MGESKGILQVCVMEVAAEEAGVVRWALLETRFRSWNLGESKKL